jgi:protein SCO1/2
MLGFLIYSFPCISNTSDFKKFDTPVEGELPYFEKEELRPVWTKSSNTIKLKKHSLESQLTSNFGSEQMLGKISLVNFFYATCNEYCPRITSNIKKIQQQFSSDSKINFISYSVTPNIDNKKILNGFANRYKVNHQNWHFVRGDRKVIYDIAKKQLYADINVDLSKSKDQFAHSESVYLIDSNLNLRGIYNSANRTSMKELAKDLNSLKSKLVL